MSALHRFREGMYVEYLLDDCDEMPKSYVSIVESVTYDGLFCKLLSNDCKAWWRGAFKEVQHKEFMKITGPAKTVAHEPTITLTRKQLKDAYEAAEKVAIDIGDFSEFVEMELFGSKV